MRRDAARDRAVLLEAARRVVARHGASAPVELVAREAGLGMGTLYRHFPSKEALVEALLDGWRDEALARIDRALAHPAPREALRLFLLDTADAMVRDLDLAALVGRPSTKPRAADGDARLRTALGGLVARCEGTLSPGIDANFLFAALAGMGAAIAAGAPTRRYALLLDTALTAAV